MTKPCLPSPPAPLPQAGEGEERKPTQSLQNSAKHLRTHMTDAEHKLWYFLRGHRFHGIKFKRQKPIGPYIVDFVCVQHALIIEVDGGQHADSSADKQRDTWLQQRGWRVLRVWNNDVLVNTAAVLEVIHQAVFAVPLPSPPAPLPQAGEGSKQPADGDSSARAFPSPASGRGCPEGAGEGLGPWKRGQ